MLRTATAGVKRGMTGEGPSLGTFAAVANMPMKLVTGGKLLRPGVRSNLAGKGRRSIRSRRPSLGTFAAVARVPTRLVTVGQLLCSMKHLCSMPNRQVLRPILETPDRELKC